MNASTFRKSAFALTTAIALFTGSGSRAQTVLASNPPQNASLVQHCDDIKMVFEYAKFKGDYKRQVDSFLGSGCASAVPVPTDTYNIPRFNTAAEVLQNGAKISLTP
ncbi:MAG: hypothetical protein WDN48_02355 [Pseudolabrys sp.]